MTRPTVLTYAERKKMDLNHRNLAADFDLANRYIDLSVILPMRVFGGNRTLITPDPQSGALPLSYEHHLLTALVRYSVTAINPAVCSPNGRVGYLSAIFTSQRLLIFFHLPIAHAGSGRI